MLFERPGSGEKAVLVHLYTESGQQREDLAEFDALVRSAGADPVSVVTGNLGSPNPATFLGRGKLEELGAAVRASGAALVLVDHQLSPGQERNLERELQCRVVDRTGLILDIFAQRARTHEGKLQVELAQLAHMSTRLVRGWTHLERQKGGIGLRGPGETQLETDRRLLRERMRSIRARLEKVRGQRGLARRARSRAGIPTLSVIGYTNAGKSTLFNRLTDAGVLAEDRLFATLDPTMRRLRIGAAGHAILVDTVGFIRHLPHSLVEAFRATLEETVHATLLLHVVDAADVHRARNIEQVREVLKEIGADELPQLLVYNKCDLLPHVGPHVERDAEGRPHGVWVSAESGAGLDELVEAICERVAGVTEVRTLRLPPDSGRLRAWLHENGRVLEESVDAEGRQLVKVLLAPGSGANVLSEVEDVGPPVPGTAVLDKK